MRLRHLIASSLFTVLAALAAGPVHGQNSPRWTVRNWTTVNGLPQNSANAIVQTEDGFLWIGTFGGLARFDGNEFAVLDVSNSPGIGDARILGLALDGDRGLWIASQDAGLLRYSNEEFHHSAGTDLLGEAWSVAVATDGAVWAGGSRGLIRVADPDSAAQISVLAQGQGQPWLISTFADGVWAVRNGEPIRRYALDGESFEEGPLPGAAVNQIRTSSEGALLMGTSAGLRVFDGNEVRAAGMPDGSQSAVRTLAVTSDGSVMGAGSRIYRWSADLQEVTELPADLSGTGNLAATAFSDREGSLWLGFRGGGLAQLRPASIQKVPLPEGVPPAGVYSMSAGPTGEILTAACPHTLRFRPTGITDLLPRLPCLGELIPARDGRMLGRTPDGRTFWLRGDSVSADAPPLTRSILRDPEGRPHRLLDDAWEVFEGGLWQEFDLVPRNLVGRITSPPALLPSGAWLPIGDSLIHVGENGIRVFEPAHGLARGQKRWFLEDAEGVIWVATYGGGLIRIENDSVAQFGVAEGLVETFLSAVLEWDSDLWLVGNRSLMRVGRAELNAVAKGQAARVYPTVLGAAEGFSETSGPDAVLTPEGALWFGTISGPSLIDIPNRPRNDAPPLPTLTSVLVDGVRITPGSPIPALFRTLDVEYTAPSFVRPEMVQFRYRLRGLSNEWVDAGPRRDAFFTSLPPRNYTFELIAVNSEGVESLVPAVIEFRVLPAFWQTWWFRVLAGLTGLAAMVLVISQVTASERRRNVALTREIRERKRLERERQELSAQLFQAQKLEAIGRLTGGIAHDFNNLLLVVTASMEMAQDGSTDPEVRSAIDTAMSAAFRGGALTRQLLSFSRREKMQMRLVAIHEVFGQMDQLLGRTLGENYDVVLDLDHALWPCITDPVGLENAVLNLAINARDSMPEGGQITISASNEFVDEGWSAEQAEASSGEYVRISVKDSGSGIADSVIENVFDPFFTTKDIGQGTGLGLSMVHGFAGQSRGFVAIDTEVGRGTTVHLFLPRADVVDVPIPQLPEEPDVPRGNSETVLLVEDNEGVRVLAARMLEDLGYQVRQAGDTATADALISSQGLPDVVLSDVLLPGENGVHFAERLRVAFPELPVLLATGFAPDSLDAAIANYEVLEKPFTRADLAKAVAEALSR